MEIRRGIRFDNVEYQGSYEEPSICPLCKHAVKPQELELSTYKDEDNHWFMNATYLCKHCYQTFVVLQSCEIKSIKNNYGAVSYSYKAKTLYIEPNRFRQMEFDQRINNLSPQFVKIYNQALAAESSGLDEIAGLGYRKAMEFLVKDFCIHKNQDESDKIKALPLSKCISTYVQNPEIQTLATRSAWIGNDEAHYIRKQEDRDVDDMKSFIQALVYFVGMALIVEDAASMSPA